MNSAESLNTFVHDSAPAKINLSLKIVGLRDDGYHLIESLVLPIDLCDVIKLEKLEGSEIAVLCPMRPDLESESNIVVSAARWYFEKAQIPIENQGIRITIEKRIPVAAGLGGGSSDAACTLRLLQHLFHQSVDDAEIVRDCWEIGADVPVLYHPRPRYVSGIGECLGESVEIEPFHLLLANPGYEVSTKWAYKNYKKNLEYTRLTNASNGGIQRHLNGASISGLLHNDLEFVTFGRHPDLAQIKETLIDLDTLGVLMSGSGPTLFAVFDRIETAKHAKRKVEAAFPGLKTWIVASFH